MKKRAKAVSDKKRRSYCVGPDGCFHPADDPAQKTYTYRGFRFCGPCGKLIGRASRKSGRRGSK